MYDKFTDRARSVIKIAQNESKKLHNDYVSTEHLLLALLREGSGVAANVLKNLGIDSDKLIVKIKEFASKEQMSPSNPIEKGEKIPFTPKLNKIIESSIKEALIIGHNYVGTEHLLLSLVSDKETVAAELLNKLNITVQDVKDDIFNMLGIPQNVPSIKYPSNNFVVDMRRILNYIELHNGSMMSTYRFIKLIQDKNLKDDKFVGCAIDKGRGVITVWTTNLTEINVPLVNLGIDNIGSYGYPVVSTNGNSILLRKNYNDVEDFITITNENVLGAVKTIIDGSREQNDVRYR